MTGFDELKETADAIREQVEARKEQERGVAVSGGMAAIQANETLRKLYKDNAQIGSENVGDTIPMLKIHSTGKSSTNELADGSEPDNGSYFYTKTREAWKTVDIHVVTISRGYKSEGINDDPITGKKKLVFTQIMAGVIITQNPGLPASLLPFFMYLSGKKLQPLWSFGKEASAYTKHTSLPIPLFCLTIQLGAKQEKTSFGNIWLPTFSILKDNTGFPVVITDEALFHKLNRAVVKAGETVAQIISSSEVIADKSDNLQSLGENQGAWANIADATDIPF